MATRKKLYYLLLMISILISLWYFNKERIILTNLSTKQWDLYKSYYKYFGNNKMGAKEIFRKVGIYELSWNGKCEYFLYNYRKKKLFKYQADDVISDHIWEYKNDSTFILNGDSLKIMYFKKDSIVLLWNNPQWLDTLILVPRTRNLVKSSSFLP